MAAERARPHSQRVGGSDLRLGSSTAVPVDAGTLLLTCEAASKTVCGGRSISSLNGDLGPMVVFFDRLLRLCSTVHRALASWFAEALAGANRWFEGTVAARRLCPPSAAG